jgi:hypothetical protein
MLRKTYHSGNGEDPYGRRLPYLADAPIVPSWRGDLSPAIRRSVLQDQNLILVQTWDQCLNLAGFSPG